MSEASGSKRQIGQILRKVGIISEEQLEDALKYQAETGFKLGECLVRLGHCKPDDVSRGLARQAGIPFVDIRKGTIPPQVIDTISRELAEEHNIVPVKVDPAKGIILAVTDPMAVFALDHLRFLLNHEFSFALTTEAAMLEALDRYYGVKKKDAGTVGEQTVKIGHEAKADDAPIIRLVDTLFEDALRVRASDIHIEPMADRVRARYRVDGVCRTVNDYPKALQGAILSRLKILSEMDISEKRKPQDGRIQTEVLARSIDVRVSALPATHGESLVMRILDKQEGLVSLERLGFVGEDRERFSKIIKRPNGLFLVTGPTGSGKTTSLYAALQDLNTPQVKIITAENPVEYQIPGINQCQVRHQIGLDFARILRAMLRQAPNVILVGEIRDAETAGIAIQAALTGHLVFSTLHTNDAASALTRLIDMGVAPFLVSSSVAAVMAQRLIRRICSHCRVEHEPTQSELDAVGLERNAVGSRTIYRAQGCKECRHSGYRGRLGIFELLEMVPPLREAVFNGEPTSRVREIARSAGGMKSLRDDALNKVLEGTTTLEEVMRVLSKEMVGA